MADWEITVTTVYCEAVDEEVTFVVNEDGTWRCTGLERYSQPNKEATRTLKVRSKRTGKSYKCAGDRCPTAGGYRDSLLSESK